MEYLDFDLKVTAGTEPDYAVSVTHSPAGEVETTMRFPFDEATLNRRLKGLETDILRSGFQGRLAPTQEEETAQDFGEVLFKTLITGEVRTRFDISLQMARQAGKGLRIRLHVEPAELSPLPWEFMYDTRRGEYVCLSRNTPIIRYIDLEQTVQPLEVTPPLQILGLISSPSDMPPLDVKREKQRLEDALKDLVARGALQLTWLEGKTWRDLQKAMRTGQWHIFHFIGHGGFDKVSDEGLIVLEDENGEADRLHATQLSRLLADNGYIRLVLLNSCEGAQGSKKDVFSSTASVLMHKGIPAVLAMQYEISDRAAIEFSSAFYQTIAEGLPVDEAVAEARKSVSLAIDNTLEWATPVLHMRSPDGKLFSIHPGAAPFKAPAPVPAAEPQPLKPVQAAVETPLPPVSVTAGAAAAAIPPSRSAATPQPAGAGAAGGVVVPAGATTLNARPFPWRIAFGVLAVLAVAVILILIFSRPQPGPAVAEVTEATPTPEITLADTFTAEPLAVVTDIPTLTPAPFIADTLEPSFTPSPEILITPTLYSFIEYFGDNSNKWVLQNASGSATSPRIVGLIANQKLTYQIDCPPGYRSDTCLVYTTIPIQPDLKNFTLLLDYTITKADANNELKLGVQFRGGNRGKDNVFYYAVYFRNDGYYFAQAVDEGKTINLFPNYLDSEGILKRDIGVTNHISIKAQDNKLRFIANDVLLKLFEDSTLTQEGDIVFGLYVSKGKSATFTIENLEIRQLP